MFGVPGAYTGTCTNQHLPSFAENQAALTEKGIDTVICMSTNDISVLDAWNAAHGAEHITMLADGNGDITRALDLGVDLSVVGMGFRTRRFAMFVDDGVVKALNVEESPATCGITSASGHPGARVGAARSSRARRGTVRRERPGAGVRSHRRRAAAPA